MRYFHFASLESTNLTARELALQYPQEVLVVTAQTQTQGRGREGRVWASPVGGAWFTLAWPTRKAGEAYAAAPLLAGLAVLESAREAALEHIAASGRVVLPPAFTIKWPNDVLLAGRKLAGILCQRDAQGKSLLVGIGINVNNAFAPAQGQEMRFPPARLQAGGWDEGAENPQDQGAAGREEDGEISVRNLIAATAERVALLLGELETSGFTPQRRQELESCLAWRNREIQFSRGGEVMQGRVMGLDEQGGLRLLTGGQERVFVMGEIDQLVET